MPKKPELCSSDNDCIETETCYMGFCVDPCQFQNVCPNNAICISKLHRPICICKNGETDLNCTSHELCKNITFNNHIHLHTIKYFNLFIKIFN